MGLYFTILVWLLNTSLCSVFISLAWKDSEPFGGPEWDVAMMQASQFLDGEHDYSKIQGPEGEPLLHPAGRLYLFSWLYYLTGGNVNKFAASIVFAAVYMATFTLVIFCYRKLEVRPTTLRSNLVPEGFANHPHRSALRC
jgi:alpha-1,3-mannosyltransferase